MQDLRKRWPTLRNSFFHFLPNLKSLNLSGNGLHTVSVSAFGLPALETLDLSRNSMPTIGAVLVLVVEFKALFKIVQNFCLLKTLCSKYYKKNDRLF